VTTEKILSKEQTAQMGYLQRLLGSGVQREGKRDTSPGHPGQGGIQRVKLANVKCCN